VGESMPRASATSEEMLCKLLTFTYYHKAKSSKGSTWERMSYWEDRDHGFELHANPQLICRRLTACLCKTFWFEKSLRQ